MWENWGSVKLNNLYKIKQQDSREARSQTHILLVPPASVFSVHCTVWLHAMVTKLGRMDILGSSQYLKVSCCNYLPFLPKLDISVHGRKSYSCFFFYFCISSYSPEILNTLTPNQSPWFRWWRLTYKNTCGFYFDLSPSFSLLNECNFKDNAPIHHPYFPFK